MNKSLAIGIHWEIYVPRIGTLFLHQVKSCDSLQLSYLTQSSKLLIMIMTVDNGDKRVSSWVYLDYIVIYNQISDNCQQVKKYIHIGYRIDHHS